MTGLPSPAAKSKGSAAGPGGCKEPSSARAAQKTDVSGGNAVLRIRVDRLEEGRLGITLDEHLVLTGVDRPDARALGWRVGDVILKANGERVRNRDELRRLMQNTVPPLFFEVVRLAGSTAAGVGAPAAQGRSGGGLPGAPRESPAAARPPPPIRALADPPRRGAGYPSTSAPQKSAARFDLQGDGMPNAAQSGGEIESWFAFVGAKILVVSDNGHTLPCTVIEVDQTRVKVHDDSGELKDQWLPKLSPHIHPDIHHDHVDYDVDEPFDFVGAKVLVMSGKGHPLPCTVVEVDAERVKVRDNAHEFDDEWLPKNSTHINPKGGGILHDGDDIDEWLAFVGAKILVMGHNGHTLPCTVIEVEEDRVKVHDESGELKDKWLPKHSPHIHPDTHDVPGDSEYVVDDPFCFVGAKVLVMSGKGHPLPCTVVEVDEDRVKVRDNAHEFEDEWLPKNSTHINPKDGGVLQNGDDIDEWLAFVGAKILVMGDNGHTLPCTVIEVEEDRVKVHDESGELNDKWLPKHSPHIHPEVANVPQLDGAVGGGTGAT